MSRFKLLLVAALSLTLLVVVVDTASANHTFRRGDANNDGVNAANGTFLDVLWDAVFLLDWGFNNGPAPDCLDACDANGDGIVFVLIDAVHLLNEGWAGNQLPPPYLTCAGTVVDCANGTCP